MEAVRPILVVAPASMLAFWGGEVALWVSTDANVITYAGSLAARSVMHDNELWLAPGSMDGKSATFRTRQALPARVRQLCCSRPLFHAEPGTGLPLCWLSFCTAQSCAQAGCYSVEGVTCG